MYFVVINLLQQIYIPIPKYFRLYFYQIFAVILSNIMVQIQLKMLLTFNLYNPLVMKKKKVNVNKITQKVQLIANELMLIIQKQLRKEKKKKKRKKKKKKKRCQNPMQKKVYSHAPQSTLICQSVYSPIDILLFSLALCHRFD